MTGTVFSRSIRAVSVAVFCLAGSVPSVRADPITVTSGHFDFGRGPANEAAFTFSGSDGFFVSAFAVPFVTGTCSATGCRPGDTVNLSVVAGADSGVTPTRLPAAFTLGSAFGAVVNGTEFAPPDTIPASFPGSLGLAGSLRFDAPPIVLSGTAEVFSSPFVFSGHMAGFAIDDVDARNPLFGVDVAGRGTAFIEFEQGLVDGVFREGVVHFRFAAAPAPTPEPTTLLMLGTGLAGMIARAQMRSAGRRRHSCR
jgi:hypothetical protein